MTVKLSKGWYRNEKTKQPFTKAQYKHSHLNQNSNMSYGNYLQELGKQEVQSKKQRLPVRRSKPKVKRNPFDLGFKFF